MIPTPPAPLPVPTAAEVVARAEKRLVPMIARRGIDAEVLRLAAMYVRQEAEAVQASADADLAAALGVVRGAA